MTNQTQEPVIDWNTYTENQIQLYRVFSEYYFSQVEFDAFKNMSTDEVTTLGKKASNQAIKLLHKIMREEPYTISDELLLFVRRKTKLTSRTAIVKAVSVVTK